MSLSNLRPLLSVLIPTYNREAYIRDCIGSVLGQQFKDFEIIVSDNDSTDRTVEIVEALALGDSRIRLLRHPANRGPLPNWAECLRAARGYYIHWLWSDDTVEPGFYLAWARLRGTHGGDIITGCAANMINAAGRRTDVCYEPQQDYLPWEHLRCQLGGRFKIALSPAAYVIPARLAQAHFYEAIPPLGALDPSKRAIGPDFLMIVGAIKECGGLWLIAEPLVNFRVHDGSISVRSHNHLTAHYIYALLWFLQKERVPLKFVSRVKFLIRAFSYRSPRMALRCFFP